MGNPLITETPFANGAERFALTQQGKSTNMVLYPSRDDYSDEFGTDAFGRTYVQRDWLANPHMTHLVVVPRNLKEPLLNTIRRSVPRFSAVFGGSSFDSAVSYLVNCVRKEGCVIVMSGTGPVATELADAIEARENRKLEAVKPKK